jgi:rSAM/selenodomain-associated transferase 2
MTGTEKDRENLQKKFSFIIPVYREQELINPCLSHLETLQRTDEIEVLVVDGDNGSTISRMDKERPFTLKAIKSPMGRGVQQNRGVQSSVGIFLIFLHVDTQIPGNACSLIENVLAHYHAGAFSLGIDTTCLFLKISQRFANIRSRFSRIPYGDQVIFIRRGTFVDLGGFQEIPLMEDVALMLQLRKRQFPVQILREQCLTSGRRWQKEGAVKGTLRNWALYTLYRLGATPERLIRWYRPHTD